MGVPYAEVIGDPIAHSKSPLIHNFWLKALGVEGDYRATRVTANELDDYLDARRADPDWRGCNLTMPLKQCVVNRLDTVHRQARQIGAVNAIGRGEDGRLHGRNTDVHGVARCLDHIASSGLTAIVIGAGGAARAAAYILRTYSAAHVTVINRSVERGQELLRDFHLAGRATDETRIAAADLVINAAPLYAPFRLDALDPAAVVFDMIYDPAQGALLAEARRRGLRAVDGLTMLVHQAAEAFSVFFKRYPPAGRSEELRALLES
ncbi:MAG: shikimate dehydrogenase [Alphaproteobacteria bacterium]|nr:MAG: shikimate dehydrogenase [Alphaproteobacteria bacterium]